VLEPASDQRPHPENWQRENQGFGNDPREPEVLSAESGVYLTHEKRANDAQLHSDILPKI
jgi:hypothetical protein